MSATFSRHENAKNFHLYRDTLVFIYLLRTVPRLDVRVTVDVTYTNGRSSKTCRETLTDFIRNV